MFKHAVNSSTRLPGPTMRVSAAGSEAKARGSISANNRRSQSFNNYDKSKPGLLPPTPTGSTDKGKQVIIWIFLHSGFIRRKSDFLLISRSCKTVWKLCVVNMTSIIQNPAVSSWKKYSPPLIYLKLWLAGLKGHPKNNFKKSWH